MNANEATLCRNALFMPGASSAASAISGGLHVRGRAPLLQAVLLVADVPG